MAKQQPGFVCAQLQRGTAGSTTFVKVAVRESARARSGARLTRVPGPGRALPDGTVAAPHVFTKVAVPGICEA
jgi:hypothetical protein